MSSSPILEALPLGMPWPALDPFLFCVHHDDAYPEGNASMGPAASLVGRQLGQDFAGKDGWRMYHGETVPGFPQHPHRGFETVTIVRRGFIDHADSLGAAARYGGGDVQWLTAGKGIVHAEMFPLLEQGATNPLELFQIWLNLPAADKLAEPHFAMFWDNAIPRVREGGTEITVVAGTLGEARPPAPPPRSWAARESDVAIWTIRMQPGAKWTLPKTREDTNRVLYFFGGELKGIDTHAALVLQPDAPLELEAGAAGAELLLLQGRPIGEPVAAHGPFVMNSVPEVRQAFADYQRTRFGGWPWPADDPVHEREAGRFARRPDGSVERP